jgi:hypothetical protein
MMTQSMRSEGQDHYLIVVLDKTMKMIFFSRPQ